MSPKISVVIPVYNGERFIRRAVFERLKAAQITDGVLSSGFFLPGLILSIAALFFFVPLLRSMRRGKFPAALSWRGPCICPARFWSRL